MLLDTKGVEIQFFLRFNPMISIITLLHITSAVSAVCSIYAAVLGFGIADPTLQDMSHNTNKPVSSITHRDFADEKVELLHFFNSPTEPRR